MKIGNRRRSQVRRRLWVIHLFWGFWISIGRMLVVIGLINVKNNQPIKYPMQNKNLSSLNLSRKNKKCNKHQQRNLIKATKSILSNRCTNRFKHKQLNPNKWNKFKSKLHINNPQYLPFHSSKCLKNSHYSNKLLP